MYLTDSGNMVVESLKTDAAEIFAGTTAGANGLADPIPFTNENTKMSVRVGAPDAGIPWARAYSSSASTMNTKATVRS